MTKAKKLAMVKQAIREPYAWPGGCPKYLIMDDGEALSIESARKQFRSIAYAVFHDDFTGWNPVAVEINREDSSLYCAHSGERIESAYAEDDIA